MLRANILGLDLNQYSNPLVTASFGPVFYLGFLSLGLIEGRIILKALQHIGNITALGGGLREVYLSPPYQHVWLSSEDRELNPLGTDPGQLSDDQIIVSFEKLYNAIQPGGIVDVILPAWATDVGDRFQKLAPHVGFKIEKSEIIYRSEGRPETEIRFEKPVPQPASSPEASQLSEGDAVGQAIAGSPEPYQETAEFEEPPVLETVAEPGWLPVSMTRLERAILKAAVGILNTRREPLPYRELLNLVYLDLVDKKIDFDSARQIENTLLNHSERELAIVEEEDETNKRLVRKWWLGEQRISPDRRLSRKPASRRARPRRSLVEKLLRKWERKPRYRSRKKTNEE